MHSGNESQPSLEGAVRDLVVAIERDDLAAVARALLARPALAKQPQPLLLACGEGKSEAARLLLDAGADPNLATRPRGGERPLSRLCEVHREGAWSPAHRALADLLLARGADPTLPCREGDQTPLLLAARSGNAEATVFLEAHLERQDRQVDLWEAAALGRVERIREALAEDRSWASRAREGGAGHFETRWTLLDLTAQSRLGLTDAAVAARLALQAELLIEAGAELEPARAEGEQEATPVWAAAASGNASVLRVLLAAGGNPDQALAGALQDDELLAVHLLDGHPLSLDQPGNLKTGSSLLHQLAQWGRFAQARWLLERGASPNPRDDQGLTPLHYAVRRGCKREDVKAFLDQGADPWLEDRRGRSVLDLAREKGREQLYPLLEAAPRSS